ncbi:MAG: EscD/YscD/HrpQ family type III secretion system inner membrane ring protein [Gammaproteobacteria bacterium]|nr:EscD/YscD/HrpQ family type III secretion system inner membrane ring protein [Gammaproteobacteria bacterium]MYF30169.1 EscD/YscD/HrpQ family type III secretion system inner membrane ring protein [Gammaproteobacteria bacterium]MYK44692.1 EscD/YscD/HrpQ family type III secretion system inner membrane ring protein [Gammaproteobacteria bacterium]
MPGRLWTMKVLAGVHAGAEVTLPDEEVVVGRDDDCDFVFEDAGLAARQFALRAGDAGVTLTPLDTPSAILIDGRRVEARMEVPAYQAVTCGRLALAFGVAGEPWPEVDLAAAAPAEAEPDATEAPDEAEIPTETSGAPPNEDTSTPAPQWRSRVTLAVAATAAAAVIAAAAWLLIPRQVEPHHGSAADAAAAINEIATRHGAAVTADAADDGTITVSGHAPTNRARARLLSDLADAGHPAVVHIVSTEQLAAYARSVLEAALDPDADDAVDVSPVEGVPGKLKISGYVADEARLARAKRLLERDVNEATGFTYAVQTRAMRTAILRKRLDALAFGGGLHIQNFPDRTGLFGPIHSSAELSRIKALADAFNAEFDGRPRLELKGSDVLLGESTVSVAVRAVVLGDNAHVVLHDGTTAGMGDKVRSGHVIDEITPRYMILRPAETRLSDAGRAPDNDYFIFEDP